jgi:hypothetical protein
MSQTTVSFCPSAISLAPWEKIESKNEEAITLPSNSFNVMVRFTEIDLLAAVLPGKRASRKNHAA